MPVELSEHLEVMSHEISGLDITMTQQGYRVDGTDGIKTVVGLAQRKSVDYFYIKHNRCLFIEFSDLARGQEDLLGVADSLAAIGNAFHRNKMHKLLKNETRDEMVTKFKDSKDIFNQLPEHYQSIPAALLQSDAKTFYIIYAPINDALPDADKALIIRFLSHLGSRVSAGLEDEICDRVKLILLDQFIALH